jgi:tetratricopeptide (TPR) repeat protein
LRYFVGAIRSAMLMKEFFEVTDQDALNIAALRRVVGSPLYGQAKEQFFNREGYDERRRLVLALRDDPKSAAYILAGGASMAREAYPRAVAEFNAALQVGDMWQETVMQRANALRYNGWRMRDYSSYVAALRDLRSLLAVDTHNPDLLMTASRLLWDVAALFPDRAAAVTEIWDVPTCRPELMNPQPFKFTHMATSNPEPDKMGIYCAIDAMLDRALLLGDSNYDLHVTRGSLYFYSLRLPARAAEEYKKAIDIDPSLHGVWGSYARALLEVGDCSGAKAALQQYMTLCSQCSTQELEASRMEFSTVTLGDQCSS